MALVLQCHQTNLKSGTLNSTNHNGPHSSDTTQMQYMLQKGLSCTEAPMKIYPTSNFHNNWTNDAGTSYHAVCH